MTLYQGLLPAILALLSGLAGAAEPVLRISDDLGRSSLWASPPQRIVSLLPSLTEIVCELGACERLVGVDRYSNHPAWVKSLPNLGGLDDINVEAVLALRPDVVLVAPSSRVSDRLQALGLKVVTLEATSSADV
jgi:iron complex transport system substrate-binding protein